MTIRDARLAKKMTQSELAKAIGVDSAMISRYENGQTRPPAKNLILMAPVLSVPVDELLQDYGYSANMVKKYTRPGDEIMCSILSKHFLSLGMSAAKSVNYYAPGMRPVVVDLLCQCKGKQWALIVSSFREYPDNGRRITVEELFERKLFNIIGQMCFVPFINKVSFVTDAPLEQMIESSSLLRCPDNLRFDISIIHFDAEHKMVDAEFELLTHYDGSGFFDLTVPGKEADSARMLAAWKTSLSIPLPKTN